MSPMWRPWSRSASKTQSSPINIEKSPSISNPHSRSRSLSFSCSSFKDIQTLIEPQSPNSPKSPSLFRRLHISASLIRSISLPLPPDSDHRIVVYYTSLRVVRRTFEDCRTVRSILRGFRVSVDERDVSMDDRFLDELKKIVGHTNVTLPVVFIRGTYVGGAEDIRRLHESGELSAMIKRLPKSDSNCCDFCGGLRFVVCNDCSGSRKVYVEKISGFRSCTSCNVNGLIRCSHCCFVLPRHTK